MRPAILLPEDYVNESTPVPIHPTESGVDGATIDEEQRQTAATLEALRHQTEEDGFRAGYQAGLTEGRAAGQDQAQMHWQTLISPLQSEIDTVSHVLDDLAHWSHILYQNAVRGMASAVLTQGLNTLLAQDDTVWTSYLNQLIRDFDPRTLTLTLPHTLVTAARRALEPWHDQITWRESPADDPHRIWVESNTGGRVGTLKDVITGILDTIDPPKYEEGLHD